MNLLILFNSLPTHIQNVIKTYYLSYGTCVANILHSYFTDLSVDSNITAWRRKMLMRQNKEIGHRGRSGYIAVSELNIAFLTDEPDSHYKWNLWNENIDIIKLFFDTKIYALNNPIFYGTPTAIFIQQLMPIITKFNKYDEDNISIWRIRVRSTGGVLTDKKLNDLKHVCQTQVYDELMTAYNEYR